MCMCIKLGSSLELFTVLSFSSLSVAQCGRLVGRELPDDVGAPDRA